MVSTLDSFTLCSNSLTEQISLSQSKKQKKLKGVTFQLVHRSQQDPLVADETAPQRVLLPVTKKESKEEKEQRLEEQHKYGIYFDDDYNYLQHLKGM